MSNKKKPKGLEDAYLTNRGWRAKGSEHDKAGGYRGRKKTQEIKYKRDDWSPQWDSTDSKLFGPIYGTLDPEFVCRNGPTTSVPGAFAHTVKIRREENLIDRWLEALNYVCTEEFEVVGGPQEKRRMFTILMDEHPIYQATNRYRVAMYLAHHMKEVWFDPCLTDDERLHKHKIKQDRPNLYAWMIKQGLKDNPQPYARW